MLFLLGIVLGSAISVTAMLLYIHKTRQPKYMSNHVDPFSNLQ